MIHVPARDYTDGAFGFLTTQALEYAGAGNEAPAQSIVAFESRGDAEEVQWLWDSWPEAGAGRNRYAAVSHCLPQEHYTIHLPVDLEVLDGNGLGIEWGTSPM